MHTQYPCADNTLLNISNKILQQIKLSIKLALNTLFDDIVQQTNCQCVSVLLACISLNNTWDIFELNLYIFNILFYCKIVCDDKIIQIRPDKKPCPLTTLVQISNFKQIFYGCALRLLQKNAQFNFRGVT